MGQIKQAASYLKNVKLKRLIQLFNGIKNFCEHCIFRNRQLRIHIEVIY